MSKTITRKYIQRITKREGNTNIRQSSGGGGGGGGGASQYWVEENYISKLFFNQLFTVYDEDGNVVEPNDTESVIASIKSMFGFWTDAYLSALGNGEGGGAELTLASLADVDVHGVANGQALVYDATTQKWVPGQGGGIDITAMWAALAQSGVQQIDASHIATALTGYATETWVGNQGYITGSALNGYATESWVGSQISDMATQTWVSGNYLSQSDAATTYVSIAYFERIFKAYNGSTVIHPNNTTSTIDNIKAMFGFWTDFYLSALGNGSGGSTSGVTMAQVWSALGNSTTEQINISHLTTALSGYNPTSNFKTINGNSIIGTGDINVGGGGGAYLPLSGGTLTGNLQIYATGTSWVEGVRMHVATNGWCGVVMCGSDNTGNSGTSAKTWSMHNNDGHFYLVLNGSNNYTYGLDWTGSGSLSVKGTSFTYNGSNVLTEAYTGFYPISGGALNSNSHIVIGDTNKNGNWSSSYISCGAGYGKNAGVYGVRLLVTQQQDAQWGFGSDLNPNIANGYDSCIASCLSSTNYCHISFVTHEVNSSTYYEMGHFDYTSGTVTLYVKGGIEANTGNFTGSNSALSLTSSSADSWIYYKTTINGTLGNRASSGYYRNFAYIANETSYARIGVADDGTPQYWTNAAGTTKYTLIHSGNIGSQSVGSAATLSTARTLWGQSFDGSADISGSLHIFSTGSGWNEGIRMHLAPNGWCGIVMCGSDNTGASGTSAKTWSMHNHDGVFGIFKQGSDTTNASDYLTNNGNWCFKSNVGIGTTSPSYKLDVAGTFYASGNSSIGGTFDVTGATTLASTLGVTGATTLSSTLGVSGATTLSSSLSVSGNSTLSGYVGIGTAASSSYALKVSGVAYASTGFYSGGYVTALSDARHKDVKGDVGMTVREVANAPAVKFVWKDRRQDGLQVGSIAQYWQKVMPEAIVKNADGELTMSYGVIALLASIATARKVEDHERRIRELEEENEKLKQQLNAA